MTAGPGDLVLPAYHVERLRRMLDRIDTAMSAEPYSAADVHEQTIYLCGYLSVALPRGER